MQYGKIFTTFSFWLTAHFLISGFILCLYSQVEGKYNYYALSLLIFGVLLTFVSFKVFIHTFDSEVTQESEIKHRKNWVDAWYYSCGMAGAVLAGVLSLYELGSFANSASESISGEKGWLPRVEKIVQDRMNELSEKLETLYTENSMNIYSEFKERGQENGEDEKQIIDAAAGAYDKKDKRLKNKTDQRAIRDFFLNFCKLEKNIPDVSRTQTVCSMSERADLYFESYEVAREFDELLKDLGSLFLPLDVVAKFTAGIRACIKPFVQYFGITRDNKNDFLLYYLPWFIITMLSLKLTLTVSSIRLGRRTPSSN